MFSIVVLIEMRGLVAITFCAGAAGLLLTAFQFSTREPVREYPSPDVREEHTILVNGVTETWQLMWTSPPKPMCEPNDVSLTCPCIGFAYGEAGDLVLIRMRNREEIDRLQLTPLFEKDFIERGIFAIVQRWQPDYSKDFEASSKNNFTALVAKRPIVQIMHFADYDHDGHKTEFYLQT